RRKIHDVDGHVLYARAESGAREIEPGLAVPGAPPEPVPGVEVGSANPGSPATFYFKCKEAVPGADVEHRATGERLRETEARQPVRRVRHDPGAAAAGEVGRGGPAAR